MKGRDLAILAAVVLLGGFALADSLRSRGEEAGETTTETTRTDRNGPEPQADAPVNWPSGRLHGTLVFTDAEDCRVRVIGLGGGRERPTGEFVGFCELWAAPIGQRIAYGTGGGVRGTLTESFSIVDLAHANFEPTTFENLSGNVLWSPDAQRLAWCDQDLNGFELDLGEERPRRLESCPVAYDPRGNFAFAVGTRLVVGGVTVVDEKETIAQAHWGVDDSLLTVLPSGAVRRYDRNGSVDSVDVAPIGDLVPSPDNCGLLVQEPGRTTLVDVGCFAGREPSFVAFDASWSPDGRWIAVAATDQIEFHQVIGGDETLVWPARARELYWRGD